VAAAGAERRGANETGQQIPPVQQRKCNKRRDLIDCKSAGSVCRLILSCFRWPSNKIPFLNCREQQGPENPARYLKMLKLNLLSKNVKFLINSSIDNKDHPDRPLPETAQKTVPAAVPQSEKTGSNPSFDVTSNSIQRTTARPKVMTAKITGQEQKWLNGPSAAAAAISPSVCCRAACNLNDVRVPGSIDMNMLIIPRELKAGYASRMTTHVRVSIHSGLEWRINKFKTERPLLTIDI
jgi:hypothetical protein